jgi:hypothetical protein
MGFVADTSSFLLVSSLSTTPQKKSHMRQPPNTAPSSMQSLRETHTHTLHLTHRTPSIPAPPYLPHTSHPMSVHYQK